MNYDEGTDPTPWPKRKIVMPKRYEGFDTRPVPLGRGVRSEEKILKIVLPNQ
jgi:hypothetical protein